MVGLKKKKMKNIQAKLNNNNHQPTNYNYNHNSLLHNQQTIRLAESTIRTFIYFSSSTSRSRRRTAIVVIIIKLIQSITSLSETTTTTTTTATDQTEDDEREETNQRLRSILGSTNDSLEILINLLSLLTLLNKHNNRLITLIATTTDLTHNILSYAHSSLQKAALWKLGRKTRLEIADTDQTIKAHKPLIRSTSIQHQQQQQQSALIDQINAHIQLNRARKLTLKRCKRGLQRIYWARIVFTIDALLSAHDLLELEYCSPGLRLLIEWTSALIDFQSAYGHPLQSLTLSNHSPSP